MSNTVPTYGHITFPLMLSSTNLGILGNLDHFRHLINLLYQSIITKDGSNRKYDKAELMTIA
jgi:hypothetical protein